MLLVLCVRVVGCTWIIEDEGIAKTILLDAHAVVLGKGGAGMVDHLCMVLRQRVVLQLLKLVSCRHVSELLSPVVIQDGARGLLVPAADYHRVGGRHRHGTHADGVHVG